MWMKKEKIQKEEKAFYPVSNYVYFSAENSFLVEKSSHEPIGNIAQPVNAQADVIISFVMVD